MDLVVYILIVYGISGIITISKIFEPLRDVAEKRSPGFWYYLVSCMQCLPFWVGIFVTFIIGIPFEAGNDILPSGVNTFFAYLFSGALFSGTTFLIHTAFVALQGTRWSEKQRKEKERKILKGVIPG